MKTLWVLTNEYEPFIIGGLGIAATNLVKALAKTGMDITVITRNPANRASLNKKGKITIARFPARYSVKKILFIMRRKGIPRPNYIHIHSLEYVPLALYCQQNWKVPLVYTLHSIVTTEHASNIHRKSSQRKLLKRVDKVVVPSQQEYYKLVSKYSFCKHKTKVIGHGVVLRKTNSRVNTNRLLFVGRLIREKGLTELVGAISILKKVRPQVRLFLIGKGDPRYISKLKRLARSKQIHHNIQWLGFYSPSRLQNAYQLYGAVVMPSKSESFGLVALEALANGVPLVSTKAGGLKMFVSGEVAQIIPKVDKASIAKAVHKMWKHPQLTHKRVAAGKKVAANFSWTKAAKAYLQIFKQ